MEKRVLFFLVAFGIFIFINGVSALGLSPAGTDINFQPGYEQSVKYSVSGASSDKEIEIYASGVLAEYVTFDKKILKGNGEFTATIKLPETLDKPGRLITYIGVREKPDPELAQMIGTLVGVNAAILVYVPYPGRYIEMEFSGNDANIGETVNFLLNLVNRGKEDVTVYPKISILDVSGVEKEVLSLAPREILTQEKIELKKVLNTSNYNAGNYKAIASIDYGTVTLAETNFRIGNLSIRILNYTNSFLIGKLQKFEIWVVSGWNNNIGSVSANVSIANASRELLSFETTSTSLTPWEEKKIEGYFDSSIFNPGIYDATANIRYYGKEQGRSTSHKFKVEFIKPKSMVVWFVVGGAGLFIIIILTTIKLFKKNGKGKKK